MSALLGCAFPPRQREFTIATTRGRPVFMMGSARSGTTLFGLMLQAHPRLAIPSETRILLPVYFGRAAFGDLADPAARRRLAESFVGRRQSMFRDLGLDGDEITERVVAEGATVGAAVGTVFRAYADRFGKPRWGDKRPNYHQYVWVLQRLFPDAQFLNIVRDGRDCVASMKKHPVWRDEPYWRVQTWVEAIDDTRALAVELPADTFFEVQYERLVADPEPQLRAVCTFLGEPFDPAMLNPRDVADQVVPDRKTWHARTRQDVSDSSVGKFRDDLEAWELSLCEAVMADHLRHYGYELTGAPPPAAEHLERYRREDTDRRARLRRQRESDAARVDAQPVADMSVEDAAARRAADAAAAHVSFTNRARRGLRRRAPAWAVRAVRRLRTARRPG